MTTDDDKHGNIVIAIQYCLHLLHSEVSNSLLPPTTGTNSSSGAGGGVSLDTETPGLQVLFRTGVYTTHQIPVVRQVLIYCHVILVLCGTTFNLALLCALVYFREQIFTNVANIFVFTLAASDVVLCGVSMPIQLYYGIDESSRVNTALCRTLFAGFGIPLYVSCLTILLIAVDRHRLIVKPTAPRVTVRQALCLICATVVFSALNAVPVGIYTESRGIEGYRSYCVEAWPKPVFRLVYSLATFLVHFLLPLLVSGGLYLEIYRRLAMRPEQLSLSKESERRKRRTTALLACVVVYFVICWTPWCVFTLLVEIDAFIAKGSRAPHIQVNLSELTLEKCQEWLIDGNSGAVQSILTPQQSSSFIRNKHVVLVDIVLKLWAMGSACVNPFLYGWLNRPIREAMITLSEIISNFCFRAFRRDNLSEHLASRNGSHVPSALRIYGDRRSSVAFEGLSTSYQQNRPKEAYILAGMNGARERRPLGGRCRCCIRVAKSTGSTSMTEFRQQRGNSSTREGGMDVNRVMATADVVVIVEAPTSSADGLE